MHGDTAVMGVSRTMICDAQDLVPLNMSFHYRHVIFIMIGSSKFSMYIPRSVNVINQGLWSVLLILKLSLNTLYRQLQVYIIFLNYVFFSQKTGYTFKKLQIDGAISQRIHMLFRVRLFMSRFKK